MKLVLQRVSSASVRVDGVTVGQIGPGLLILVGIGDGDNEADARRLAQKTVEMRIFGDAEGHFNHSLLDTGGEALIVSQFTLFADTRRGRRPGFSSAARPEIAEPLVDAYAAAIQALGVRVARGRFATHMAVELINDGPVTILIDSAELERPRRQKGD